MNRLPGDVPSPILRGCVFLYAGVILAIPSDPATCQKTQRSFFGSHFRKIYSFNFNKLLKFTERFGKPPGHLST